MLRILICAPQFIGNVPKVYTWRSMRARWFLSLFEIIYNCLWTKRFVYRWRACVLNERVWNSTYVIDYVYVYMTWARSTISIYTYNYSTHSSWKWIGKITTTTTTTIKKWKKFGVETHTAKSHHSISPRTIKISWYANLYSYNNEIAATRRLQHISASVAGISFVHTSIKVDCGYLSHLSSSSSLSLSPARWLRVSFIAKWLW